MVRRTRTTINRSLEFNLDRDVDGTNPCPEDFREKMRQFPKGTGAFARLLRDLLHYHYPDWEIISSEWHCVNGRDVPLEPPMPTDEQLDQQIRAALADARITMIGHSTGAILINELLDRFRDLPYADIVVMASAASMRDTRRVLNRYFEDAPEGDPDTNFYALILDPLNHARERQYAGAVPSGSLLMWIDGMYGAEDARRQDVRRLADGGLSVPDVRLRGAEAHALSRVQPSPGRHERPHQPDRARPVNEDDTCFWRPSFWGVAGTSWEGRYAAALLGRPRLPCGEQHEAPLRNQVPPAAS